MDENLKEKYKVKPVKVNKKRNHKSNLSGEDIAMLQESSYKSNHKSICDTHEDGA